MAKYLFIEAREPFDGSDSDYLVELVEGLSARGNEATVFLVQNGVFPLRKGSKKNDAVSRLIRSNVKVLADGFSLRERAIKNVVNGVEVADVGRLVDLLMEPGTKAVWH